MSMFRRGGAQREYEREREREREIRKTKYRNTASYFLAGDAHDDSFSRVGERNAIDLNWRPEIGDAARA